MSMAPVQPYIDEAGRVWRKFDVVFDSDGRRYSFDLWAIDEYHANLRLEDLKHTARIEGEIISEGQFS